MRFFTKVSAMLKTLASLMMLCVVLLFFSGCANEQALDLSSKAVEKIPVDIGRFSAHVAIRAQEEATKQKALEAEKAQADADKARYASGTFVLDSVEKIQAYSLAEMGKSLADAVKTLARRDSNEHGFATTPTPKGVIAESLDSLGGAVAKVADTPAALAGSVGLTAVKISKAAIDGASDRVNVDGNNNQVTTTKTQISTKATNTGDGTANGSDISGTAGSSEKTKTEAVEAAEEVAKISPTTL